MPKSPAFDNYYVLDQAMEVFWRQGYHATSIRDLVKATGLQPGSLYAAFGGKRQLFQRVLDHYHESNVDRIREHLNADTTPVKRIRDVFEHLLQYCQEDLEGKGCLMANTILELSCVDADLSRRANNMFDDVEEQFLQVIKEGQIEGQIPPAKDPLTLARYLVMSIHGIRVYSRGNLDSSHLHALVDETLDFMTGEHRPAQTD
ncbi:MAG: HTH-type transcriptional repressor ComR [Gammaproteobacteria bacterium]|nr:HTH-type transcriptional repressor ComR [Gammaproteobacteria bacterium]